MKLRRQMITSESEMNQEKIIFILPVISFLLSYLKPPKKPSRQPPDFATEAGFL